MAKIKININNYLTKGNFLDFAFPVGTILVRNDSTSPASLYGGTWDLIAENVTMPLGSIAPVWGVAPTEVSDGNWKFPQYQMGSQPVNIETSAAISASATKSLSVLTITNKGSSAISQYARLSMPTQSSGIDNLAYTDLSSATNAVTGVYLYQRVS